MKLMIESSLGASIIALLTLTIYSGVSFGYIVDLKTSKVNVTKQYCDEQEYIQKYNKTSLTFPEFIKSNPVTPKSDYNKTGFEAAFDRMSDEAYLNGACMGFKMCEGYNDALDFISNNKSAEGTYPPCPISTE